MLKMKREVKCPNCGATEIMEFGYAVCEKCGADFTVSCLINLTPHTINEVISGKAFPSEGVARCLVETKIVREIDGIPVAKTCFGKMVDLPPKTEGVFYIVSRLVKQAIPDRDDCLCPGELVRDKNGQPNGCRGFSL